MIIYPDPVIGVPPWLGSPLPRWNGMGICWEFVGKELLYVI